MDLPLIGQLGFTPWGVMLSNMGTLPCTKKTYCVGFSAPSWSCSMRARCCASLESATDAARSTSPLRSFASDALRPLEPVEDHVGQLQALALDNLRPVPLEQRRVEKGLCAVCVHRYTHGWGH